MANTYLTGFSIPATIHAKVNTMQMLTIPNTNLTVSALSLGGVGLGTRTTVEDSMRLLDAYVELGGNFLDSAHIYAAWVPGGEGTSERTIGKWLQTRGNRSQIVIGTKGGHPHMNTMHIPRLSPEEIKQDLQESLERLQVDTIDVYWLHRDDPARPVGEMLETLNAAVAQEQNPLLRLFQLVGRAYGGSAAICASAEFDRLCRQSGRLEFCGAQPECRGYDHALHGLRKPWHIISKPA